MPKQATNLTCTSSLVYMMRRERLEYDDNNQGEFRAIEREIHGEGTPCGVTWSRMSGRI